MTEDRAPSAPSQGDVIVSLWGRLIDAVDRIRELEEAINEHLCWCDGPTHELSQICQKGRSDADPAE